MLSFSTAVCTAIRSRSNKIVIFPLLAITTENLAYVKTLGSNSGIDPDSATLTSEMIQSAHAEGVMVGTWIVNYASDIKKFVDWGVDFITTDSAMWRG